MSDEFDDIVDNLREPSAWIRILFMVGFALLLYLVITPVMLVLGLAQALFAVLTGSDNEKLRILGGALVEYVHQILSFFTYNTNEKPFPFSDFPEMNFPDDDQISESEVVDAEPEQRPGQEDDNKEAGKKEAVNKKATKKKSTVKKKSSKKDTKTEARDTDEEEGDADEKSED